MIIKDNDDIQLMR